MSRPAYRKFRRQNGIFFAEEVATKKQFSLRTRDPAQAELELRARNDKAMGPAFNRQIGMVYLANASEGLATRTWQDAMDHYGQREMRESSKDRVVRAFKSKAFDPIRRLILNQTRPEDFLAVVIGPKRQSALHYARRLYNDAIDMGWLLSPFMNKSTPRSQASRRGSPARRNQ